jgi:hypothetical protein
MDPTDCAYAAIRAMYNKETELWICPFSYKLLIPLLQVFPSLASWYLMRRLPEQLRTLD